MYGGLSASPDPRESTEEVEGPSKAKARLVRRLSASSAMIAAAPVDAPTESYLTYIEHIPPEDGPQMFGMHASVSIVTPIVYRVFLVLQQELSSVDLGSRDRFSSHPL